MQRRFAVSIAFAVLLAPLLARAAESKPATFKHVVEASFKHWDKDGDGKLSPLEINVLVRSHSVTGDAAAAVAAIHSYYRDHAKSSQLTKPVLLGAAGKNKAARDIDELFDSFRDHIRSAPRQLFVDNALPSLHGVQQGDMGDCFFLCIVGACVHHHPQRVKEMFHPQPDGACEVHFPNGQHTVVPRLTDAQIALGSSAGQQGLWLNVLEEALGRCALAKKKHKKATDLPEDLIALGGDSQDIFPVMTGHRGTEYDFKESKDSHAAIEAKLRDKLKHGADHKLIMATSTAADAKRLPAAIGEGHAFSVLGYDAKADKVIVWDPYGHHHKPKDPPGLKNGYATRDGRYEVPVAEFAHIFSGLEWETSTAVKKK